MMANTPTDDSGRQAGYFPRRSTGTRGAAARIPKRWLAWSRVRHLARQAINRRMTTEMADLAARIRKLHDSEAEAGRAGERR